MKRLKMNRQVIRLGIAGILAALVWLNGCGRIRESESSKAAESARQASLDAAEASKASAESSRAEAESSRAAAESSAAAPKAAEEASKAAEEAAKRAKYRDKSIGILLEGTDSGETGRYEAELIRYLTQDIGFAEDHVTVYYADGSRDEQTKQLQSLLKSGVSALIIDPILTSSAPYFTDQCTEAGVPVIYIGKEPDDAEEQRWVYDGLKAAYVGVDPKEAGRLQGELILDLPDHGDINEDGVVSYMLIQGKAESMETRYRTEYALNTLSDAGVKTQEVFRRYADWDREESRADVAEALKTVGEGTEIIICNNDAMALGAADAIEEVGRSVGEDIYLVGVGADEEAVEAVENGRMSGTILNDEEAQARKAADVAAAYVNGSQQDEQIHILSYVKVTAGNAGAVLAAERAEEEKTEEEKAQEEEEKAKEEKLEKEKVEQENLDENAEAEIGAAPGEE